MSKRKDVEEYQILFNVTADRDDFYTEDESEYEEMMDETFPSLIQNIFILFC